MTVSVYAKSVMLKDRDYDVTPYIIAHILRQIRKGSANSTRWGGDREDGGGEQCGLGWR